MFSLLLLAAVAAAELPEATRTEMSFARLLATRVAMQLAHGSNANPKRLSVIQANGRVEMRMADPRRAADERLLMIGLVRSPLSRRMNHVLKRLKSNPLHLTVRPPVREDWPTWIERTADAWKVESEILQMDTGVAPADLVEQRVFSNWEDISAQERKRLTPIKYADILYQEAPEISGSRLDYIARELAVLGLSTDLSTDDLVELNLFLERAPCGTQVR